jgi:TatD DNase family protein
MMRLFDSHTHLQFPEFNDDRDAVLSRAREAGVEAMVVVGTDVASSEKALALADSDPGLYAAVGCHPHVARHFDSGALDRLRKLASHPRAVAIGEIGLDFYRNLSPRDAQMRALRQQLALAADVGLPIVVHCRDADEETYPVLAEWVRALGQSRGERPVGVMHYFSGSPELAHRYVELEFLISIHTSVTYPNAGERRAVAAALPLDSLVVETDCPYGAPQSRRGQRGEPADVAEAVAEIAELRGTTAEEIATRTSDNAWRLVGASSAVGEAVGPRREAWRK